MLLARPTNDFSPPSLVRRNMRRTRNVALCAMLVAQNSLLFLVMRASRTLHGDRCSIPTAILTIEGFKLVGAFALATAHRERVSIEWYDLKPLVVPCLCYLAQQHMILHAADELRRPTCSSVRRKSSGQSSRARASSGPCTAAHLRARSSRHARCTLEDTVPERPVTAVVGFAAVPGVASVLLEKEYASSSVWPSTSGSPPCPYLQSAARALRRIEPRRTWWYGFHADTGADRAAIGGRSAHRRGHQAGRKRSNSS